MADPIVAEVRAPVHLICLADPEGRPGWFLESTIQQLRARGLSSIPGPFAFDMTKTPDDWLTVTQVAEMHRADLLGMTLKWAVNKVSRACGTGSLESQGKGPDRRIAPNNARAWCQKQNLKNPKKLN